MAQAQTTFNVDMSCAPEGFTDVFVTGPWCGWCANDVYNTMTDDDGDGIYSVTVTIESAAPGDLVEYKYGINGFADQENLVNDMVDGASCAPVTDYSGYANRQIPAGDTANDSYGTCDGTCNDSSVAPPYDVTFRLDVGAYSGSVSAASMFGSFSGWDGNGNPMSDVDGDGVYELTLALEPGLQEYKYRINFSADESFDGSEPCTTDPAEYVNRVIDVADNVTLDVVCWNSCDACGDGEGNGTELPTYDLTFNVNMTNAGVSADGVFLAGGAAFGEGVEHSFAELLDPDGDGIFVDIASGLRLSSDYTFVNGIGWGNKEDISGQDCAVPPYNDRRLDAMSGPVTISTCFGQCTDDGSCAAPASDVNVTFNVDVSQENLSAVYVFGSFNGWNDGEIQMEDPDADGTYSATLPLAPGNYEFKFVGRDANNNVVNEILTEGDACTVNGPPYVNRALEVPAGGDLSLSAPCFGSCDACDPDGGDNGGGDSEVPVYDLTFNVNTANISVGPNGLYLGGGVFGDALAHAMSDDDGDGTWSVTLSVDSGFAGYYIFLNSPNNGADWGVKENLTGQPCADPGNFDDRILDPVTGDTVISTCFGECTTDGSCSVAPSVFGGNSRPLWSGRRLGSFDRTILGLGPSNEPRSHRQR